MTDDTTARLAPQLVAAELDGETVILDPDSGHYYSLNAVATVAWQRLREGPATLGELVTLVCERFDVTPMRCRPDLEEWLHRMADARLLSLSHG